MPLILTLAEYRKKKMPQRDETQMLLAVNSRYEDMGGKRIHIMPGLDEPVMIRERKKITGLHVPDVDAISLDLLAEYGCVMTRPLWVRPPFILPSSWAPWSLEAGRSYMLASRQWSTPYPSGTSKQAHWQWCLDNLHGDRQFLPRLAPDLAKDATEADVRELNIRLWDDARSPGSPGRKGEIQAIALRAVTSGGNLEDYAPILPTDRDRMHTSPNDEGFHLNLDNSMLWHGAEEAEWACMLNDPDIDLFGLDEDESLNPDSSKNLFLESDNLLALKRLRRGYEGKVKLTYTDPPYNTGGKFVYNDNFHAAPNTGSPFTGQRWGHGTWLVCFLAPWANQALLSPKKVSPVGDDMLAPGSAS